MISNNTGNSTAGWCDEYSDGFTIWPATEGGYNATKNCSDIKQSLKDGTAYMYCNVTGKWETRNNTNKTYAHYADCLLPKLNEVMEMCDKFGDQKCAAIGKVTREIEMIGLSFSFISLVISLFIFFSYRVLRNNRTKIHTHLFIATIFHVIVRLIRYTDQAMDEKLLCRWYLYETCIFLLEYGRTTMFMWMFIEGLYLHNMITVTVFQEYTYIKVYCYVGWIVPGIMTFIWLTGMIVEKASWKYYYFENYYWILEGPRETIIVVNILFLLNIIRVLVAKLRDSHTSELEQVRKAVRATVFLLPLMGTSNILFLFYKFDEAWKFAVWNYTAYFLGTFQGFFVAVLYCFLNGEVQAAIRNSFYLHMSLRNYDYAPCRNFAFISIAVDENNMQNGRPSKWLRCCKPTSTSEEENEIRITELTNRRNTLREVSGTSTRKSSKDNWFARNVGEETDSTLIDSTVG